MKNKETSPQIEDLAVVIQKPQNDELRRTHWPLLSIKAENVLFEIGFEPGDDLTDVSIVDIVAVPGGGPKIVKEIFSARHAQLKSLSMNSFTLAENRKAIKALRKTLGVRATNVVAALDPTTVVDFVNIPWDTLFQTQSCGRETFDQIVQAQNIARQILIENPTISTDSFIRKIRTFIDP